MRWMEPPLKNLLDYEQRCIPYQLSIKRKKAKGVKEAVVKYKVKYSNYVDFLLNECTYLHSMTSLRS